MPLLCHCYVTAMSLLCHCYVTAGATVGAIAMPLLCHCYVTAMPLLCCWSHCYATAGATAMPLLEPLAISPTCRGDCVNPRPELNPIPPACEVLVTEK